METNERFRNLVLVYSETDCAGFSLTFSEMRRCPLSRIDSMNKVPRDNSKYENQAISFARIGEADRTPELSSADKMGQGAEDLLHLKTDRVVADLPGAF
jgi:hypothetical protein